MSTITTNSWHGCPAQPARERLARLIWLPCSRGHIVPKGDLTALDTNIVVMQILDAARESARTGRTVRLTKLGDD